MGRSHLVGSIWPLERIERRTLEVEFDHGVKAEKGQAWGI